MGPSGAGVMGPLLFWPKSIKMLLNPNQWAKWNAVWDSGSLGGYQ